MKNDIFITYRHFRVTDVDAWTGQAITNPKGGATLAFFVDLRDPENRYAIVGYALCSDKDHFCKELGRKKAYSRLNQARQAFKIAEPGTWYYSVFEGMKFKVIPKDEGGTLCLQFLNHIADLKENEGFALGSEAHVLHEHLANLEVI
jgi:hypothetical protein